MLLLLPLRLGASGGMRSASLLLLAAVVVIIRQFGRVRQSIAARSVMNILCAAHPAHRSACTAAHGPVLLIPIRLRGIVRNLVEEHTDALSIMTPSNRLGKHVTDIDLLELFAFGAIERLRERVGHDELLQLTLADSF